jgi:hypothetical protein
VLRDVKEVLIDYSIIGGTMAILTALIKPFVCWKKTIKDSILVFTFSLLCGLLIQYWEIPEAVKFGVSGVCGYFAVRINEVIESILLKAKNNPEKILDKLSK